MRRFTFHRAADLDEVLALKARVGERASVLAGGTDLIIRLRAESASLPPIELIDITRVRELRGISTAATGGSVDAITLGPLSTHAEICANPLLRRAALLLVQAAFSIGSPQIRNRGTVGGNLCNAAACADTVPPLVALGAELVLQSVRRSRTVPAEQFFLAPYHTTLAADEVVSAIRFDEVPEEGGSSFVKLGRRNALSISRMSIAVVIGDRSAGILRGIRIAAGSVTPTIRRFPSVERILEGAAYDHERLEAAGQALAQEMIQSTGVRWSTPYKEPVLAALLRRAVRRAAGWGAGS